MRKFKFNTPSKVTATILEREYKNNPAECYYERSCSVITKYGIVVVDQMRWEHNFGYHDFSIFTTVINGVRYTATLKEGKISDREIKWKATNFIKTVLKRISNGEY